MEYFSHSKISTFEQCKLKYKFRYIDKIKPEIEKSIEAHLGSCVHSSLEWLYGKVKNEKRVPTIDELVMNYSKIWNKTYNPNIQIVKKEFSAKDYFNKGLRFLMNYYTENKPFDENTLEIEKYILINLDKEGEYKLRGYIDRLVYNIEEGVYEVHDYKTANSMPTKEKVENDRQLALYSIAIKEKFGYDKEVRLIWHYLSFNRKIKSRRTDEQLKKLKKETLNLIKEIKSTTQFPPTRSVLCNWCEYRSICPAWGNSKNETTTKIDDFPNKTKEKELKKKFEKTDEEKIIKEDLQEELEK